MKQKKKELKHAKEEFDKAIEKQLLAKYESYRLEKESLRANLLSEKYYTYRTQSHKSMSLFIFIPILIVIIYGCMILFMIHIGLGLMSLGALCFWKINYENQKAEKSTKEKKIIENTVHSHFPILTLQQFSNTDDWIRIKKQLIDLWNIDYEKKNNEIRGIEGVETYYMPVHSTIDAASLVSRNMLNRYHFDEDNKSVFTQDMAKYIGEHNNKQIKSSTKSLNGDKENG